MYYWVNFINALCYNVNKTIEFRLLRPTYNFEKILTWISIFNAILSYAENADRSLIYNIRSLEDVIRGVYQGEFLENVLDGIQKLKFLTINQINNEDVIGSNTEMENAIFNLE